MNHLLIALNFIVLITGILATYFLFVQKKNFKSALLTTYIYHLTCINLIIFSLFVSEYFMLNILVSPDFQSTGNFPAKSIIWLLKQGVIIFAVQGFGYTLIKIIYQLNEKLFRNIFKTGFVIILILSALVFGSFSVILLYSANSNLLEFFRVIISVSWIVLIIGLLISELIKSKNSEINERIKITKSFLFFYSFTIPVLLINNLINFSFFYQFIISLILFLFLIIFPVIRLKVYLEQNCQSVLNPITDNKSINGIINKYKITKREREVFELVINGYSNKYIMEHLFISINTVRNHIYNLYKKLGVNSRVELIRFIMEISRNEGSNSSE